MTMSNKEKVDSWRKRKGNKKRKSNYQLLISLGIHWEQAGVMRFWSDERIEQYLETSKVVDPK